MKIEAVSPTELSAQRKELVLFIRARLRQDSFLRKKVVSAMCAFLGINENKIDMDKHLTIALDEELNDTRGHVIL